MGQVDGFLTYERHQLEYEEVADRVKHYEEFVKPVSEEETNEQAARCMDCGIPFCHSGCPLGNKIPDFNDAVYRGEFKEAWQVLKSTNNFPEFTGRICPAPCEGSCVLGINNDAVSIEHIEKTIAETAWAEGWEVIPDIKIKSGKTVGIIGSGPAGLAAADQLSRQGHDVTVFERDVQAGGLLRFGIPDFKLDKSVVQRRVDLMKQAGVKFELGVEVGKDIDAKELESKFDAIVLTTGATKPRDLPIPGRDLDGIHLAMKFLKANSSVVQGEASEVPAELHAGGHNVVVIGGGDTGSDCVGTSNRHGAKSVTQIELLDKPSESREATNPWPEWPMILRTSTSQKEGVERSWSILTKEFVGENGKLTGLKLVDVEWTDKSKFQFNEIEGSERVVPCERAYLAIGFLGPEQSILEQLGVETNERSNISDNMYQTNKENIFAAGDCRRGQSLVVWAISEGRKAAYSVNKYLTA